jgi:broad specificity phosphatase PhoE
MVARLVLVRHGRSAHVHATGAIDRAAVERLRAVQDEAGIQMVSEPPRALVQMAVDATHIVASDLRRAVASAERLAPHRSVQISALLRETVLPIPDWRMRLPPRVWETLIHLRWSYQILRGTDATSAELARAAAAAEWLARLVDGGSTALVVTHGVFRRLVAKQLIALGWADTGRRGGYSHWSAWGFASPAQTDGSRHTSFRP